MSIHTKTKTQFQRLSDLRSPPESSCRNKLCVGGCKKPDSCIKYQEWAESRNRDAKKTLKKEMNLNNNLGEGQVRDSCLAYDKRFITITKIKGEQVNAPCFPFGHVHFVKLTFHVCLVFSVFFLSPENRAHNGRHQAEWLTQVWWVPAVDGAHYKKGSAIVDQNCNDIWRDSNKDCRHLFIYLRINSSLVPPLTT